MWVAPGCVPSFPTKSTDAGDATDATMHDASNGCATKGTGAVGTIGCPCANSGALGCSGNDSMEQIICSPANVWGANGPCAAGTVCATAGPNTGRCQPVLALCADAGPGERRCATASQCGDGGSEGGAGTCIETPEVVSCGPDLLTTTVIEGCAGTCIDGACTGVCMPGTAQCADGGQIIICSAVGAKSATTCPSQCSAGQCAVTWSPDENATAIAINDTDVYWVDGYGTTPSLWRSPLTAVAPQSLYSAAGGSLLGVALDTTAVYWTVEERLDGGTSAYLVLALPFAGDAGGGTPVTLAAPASEPVGLAADTYYVYWGEAAGNIAKAPVQAGATATLATGQAVEGLTVDPSSGSLYWINNSSPGEGATGSVVELTSPRMGGSPVTLATPIDPVSLAVYSGTVFWTTSSTPTIASRAAGGTVTTLATGDLQLPYLSPAIAANGTTLAWISRNGLFTMPIAGGPMTMVSSHRPEGLAMSSSFLVWTGQGSTTDAVFGQAPP